MKKYAENYTKNILSDPFLSLTNSPKQKIHARNSTENTRFDLYFRSAVVKMYFLATLCWVNNNKAQQIFPAHMTIYFSQLLIRYLLSETTVYQTQATFICSNSAILTLE